jgi:putative tryptophan/tyrosine transport system substrate-binding protein
MNRRDTVLALLALLTLGAIPLAAGAQQVRRIGILMPGIPENSKYLADVVVAGLRELGWTEGQNLALDYRFAHGDLARIDALAAELIERKPDVIVASVSVTALAVFRATRKIPIVFCNVADPVAVGLVASLSRPGGNATGLAILQVELISKKLEILKEVLPQLKRVALVVGSATARNVSLMKEVERYAEQIGIRIIPIEEPTVRTGIEQLFERLAAEHADGLVSADTPYLFGYRREIAERTARAKIPAVSSVTEFVEAGGLMSYGANLVDQYRRAAGYVDKILRGARPSELPVQQPLKFELVINLKTAKALGLKIPPSVLLRADRVIE